MDNHIVEISSVDTWEDTYRPITNFLDDDASFTGTMFETYGAEHEVVMVVRNTNKVWTLIGGDGGTYIINGYHWINRLGYFITAVPYKDDTDYTVTVETDQYEGEANV